MFQLISFLLLTLVAMSANAQSRILTPTQCAEKLNFQRCLGFTQADLATPRTQAESLAFIKANICSPQCTDMWTQYATLGPAFIEQQCGGKGASVPAEWGKAHVHRDAHAIMCTQDAQGTLCASSLAQSAAKRNLTRPVDTASGKLMPYPLAALPRDIVCSECTAKLVAVAREMDEQAMAKGEVGGVGIHVPFDDRAVVERRAMCLEEEKKTDHGEQKPEVGTRNGAGENRGTGVFVVAFGMMLSLAMLLAML